MQCLDGHLGLEPGLQAGGAAFADHPVDQRVDVFLGQACSLAQHLGALFVWRRRPCLLCLRRSGSRTRDLRRVGQADLTKRLPGGGLDHRLALRGSAPLTIEEGA
ncbi:hypothetical protein D3C72_949700 [compost metagenome]